MESINRIGELVARSLAGKLTAAERQELDAWLQASPANRELYDTMTAPGGLETGLEAAYETAASRDRVWAQLQEATAPAKVRRLPLRRWLPYAAAAILLTAAATLWLQRPAQPQQSQPGNTAAAAAIPPGTTGAVLTLADGRQLELDSIRSGTIASQGATQLVLQNGRLSYQGGNKTPAVAYNTITTPRGRQFQLVLHDGTRVWLNAASSITYPTAFSDTARHVSITGEAYFEVAHRPAAPFKVKISQGHEVTVLGTRFNVNAYTDEPEANTTLLEGSVKVSSAGVHQVLQPGYQAGVRNNRITVRPADVNGIMAWKNGLFIFQKTDVHAVMRQLSRWYDVEVIFEGEPGTRQLTGEVYRNYTLQQALAVLQEADLHVRISGRTLTVLP